jgi:hypothetical protein
MGGRDLAGQDHLDAGKHRVGGARFAGQRRVFKDQHAALGFLRADQAAGFHHQGFDGVVVPDHGFAARHRLLGDDGVHDLPQRRHAVLGDAVVEGLPHGIDIVLGIGLAVGFLRGGDRHGVSP